MKKRNNKTIVLIVIGIFFVVLFGIFILNYSKDDASFSILEKKWISDNTSNIIDVSVYNDVPVYGNKGKGVIFDLLNDFTDKYKITPVLNKEMLLLGKDMSNKLLCSLVSAYQVMLPKALKAEINTNIKIKYNKYLKRLKSIEEIDEYIKNCKYESQINILCKLKEGDILITKMTSSINTIIKYGFAKIVMEEEKKI